MSSLLPTNYKNTQHSPQTMSELRSLLKLTIEKASEGLNSGLFTSVDLYIARIEEASDFKAVLQVNPDALTITQDLDNLQARYDSKG